MRARHTMDRAWLKIPVFVAALAIALLFLSSCEEAGESGASATAACPRVVCLPKPSYEPWPTPITRSGLDRGTALPPGMGMPPVVLSPE